MLAFPQQEDSGQDSTSEVPRSLLSVVILLELLEESRRIRKCGKASGCLLLFFMEERKVRYMKADKETVAHFKYIKNLHGKNVLALCHCGKMW